MKLSPNNLCPCGSTKKAKRCCGPLLDGQPAPTPEALMRSRYVAYSLGDVAYVQRTTHSHSPHREADLTAWTARLRQFCEETTFVGLRVLSAETVGEQGVVRFWASLHSRRPDAGPADGGRALSIHQFAHPVAPVLPLVGTAQFPQIMHCSNDFRQPHQLVVVGLALGGRNRCRCDRHCQCHCQ